MTVKDQLRHSTITVTVTMCCTHSNLDSKVATVGNSRATATIELHRAPISKIVAQVSRIRR